MSIIRKNFRESEKLRKFPWSPLRSPEVNFAGSCRFRSQRSLKTDVYLMHFYHRQRFKRTWKLTRPGLSGSFKHMWKSANDEKPRLRMQLSLRCLLNMKGTSVDCSCSYKACVWQPYTRFWDRPHGTETRPSCLGSSQPPTMRPVVLSRPSSGNPWHPSRGTRTVCIGWLPALDTTGSNAPISAVT